MKRLKPVGRPATGGTPRSAWFVRSQFHFSEPPVTYGELRRRRLAQLEADRGKRRRPPLTDAERKAEYKRIDKELSDGLRWLTGKQEVRRLPDGRYALLIENALADLQQKYMETETDLIRFVASLPTRLPDLYPINVNLDEVKGRIGGTLESVGVELRPSDLGRVQGDSLQFRRELSAAGLNYLSLMRSGWRRTRSQLLEFIERGDDLYLGITRRPIEDPQADPRADPDRYDDLRRELLQKMDRQEQASATPGRGGSRWANRAKNMEQ